MTEHLPLSATERTRHRRLREQGRADRAELFAVLGDGDSPDARLGLWAGELPITAVWAEPVPDPGLPSETGVPGHIGGRAGAPVYPRAT